MVGGSGIKFVAYGLLFQGCMEPYDMGGAACDDVGSVGADCGDGSAVR